MSNSNCWKGLVFTTDSSYASLQWKDRVGEVT